MVTQFFLFHIPIHETCRRRNPVYCSWSTNTPPLFFIFIDFILILGQAFQKKSKIRGYLCSQSKTRDCPASSKIFISNVWYVKKEGRDCLLTLYTYLYGLTKQHADNLGVFCLFSSHQKDVSRQFYYCSISTTNPLLT